MAAEWGYVRVVLDADKDKEEDKARGAVLSSAHASWTTSCDTSRDHGSL